MKQRWSVRDIAPALVGAVLIPAAMFGIQRQGPHWAGAPVGRDLDLWGVGLLVVAGAALLWRRRAPVVTLGVVTASITAYLWLGYPYGPPLLVFMLAVYSVAAHRPLRVSAPAAALAGLALLSHVLSGTAPGTGTAIGAAWVVVGFTIGLALRTWRESRTREREAILREQLDAERISLSRDVHDVVGHGLAAINMQARVALRSVDRDDEHGRRRVRESLEDISASSAAALAELRAVLARIPTDGETRAPRAPALGLADVPALAQRLGRTGMRVDLTRLGTPVALPAAADLAAYRIAQEALTNALRHGEASTAVEVVIEHRPRAVLLSVSNAVGAAETPDEPRSGMGIPGMRDRVTAVGGTLEIDPGPPRFVVRATIPTQEDR